MGNTSVLGGEEKLVIKRRFDMRICPICGKKYDNYPALSRKDNKTEICPGCGMKEAMDDYCNFIKERSKCNDDKADC